MPLTLGLAQTLADRVAGWRGRPTQPVPDLGPAAVMDQLTVLVWDVYATRPEAEVADVVTQLSGIRHHL